MRDCHKSQDANTLEILVTEERPYAEDNVVVADEILARVQNEVFIDTVIAEGSLHRCTACGAPAVSEPRLERPCSPWRIRARTHTHTHTHICIYTQFD